jgi:hypothetical protein
MTARYLTAAALIATTAACSTVSPNPGMSGDTRGLSVTRVEPRAQPGQGSPTERAFAGDAVYLDGQFASVPMLVMTADASATLRDDRGEAMAFRLPRASLVRAHTDGRVDTFCALGDVPGIVPEPAPGSCTGVRHERETGRLEWIVGEIRGNAVVLLARAQVATSSDIRFNEGRRLMVDERTLVEEIVFEGYSDGEIRFVRTLYQDQQAATETFAFDYPPRTGMPVYRIGDRTVEVKSVSPGQLEYRVRPL